MNILDHTKKLECAQEINSNCPEVRATLFGGDYHLF